MKDEKKDPSVQFLKVVNDNIEAKAKSTEAKKTSIEAEMKSDLNMFMMDSLISQDKVGQYLKMIQPFLPMGVEKLRKFFGPDKIRLMAYVDDKTGALIFQKIDTDNIADLNWHEEPKAEDFFIVQNEDLDNPGEFLKTMMKKFNMNLI